MLDQNFERHPQNFGHFSWSIRSIDIEDLGKSIRSRLHRYQNQSEGDLLYMNEREDQQSLPCISEMQTR